MSVTLEYKDAKIQYVLEYKAVKNINLRIKQDGTICVSANRRIPRKIIDEFVLSKAEFIFKAIERYKQKTENHRYFREDELKDIILALCEKAYPYYRKFGIEYPKIKFRRMVSRWGSCNPVKGIVTFNLNLVYAPYECVEYVVLHEFTHFLQANHSKKFYDELGKVCSDWKARRKTLKEIRIG